MILKWQYIVCIKGKILYKLKETFFDNSFLILIGNDIKDIYIKIVIASLMSFEYFTKLNVQRKFNNTNIHYK